MNCPQCQAPNQQDSAFCANCGTQLAPAAATAPPGGYFPPSGQSAPPGYGPGAPGAPGAPGPQGYGPPGGYPPPGQQPPTAGYPQVGGQGQYQPQPARTPATPVEFDLKRLDQADRIVGVASLITLISIWLPWYSYAGVSASGTSGHGWLWLVFVLDLLILGYLAMRAGWDEPPVRLPLGHAQLLIAATGLQLLLIVIAFADIPYSNLGVGWDWGAFVGLLAALVAAAPFIVPAVRSYLQSRR